MAVRPANPHRVPIEADAPSSVLKVSGLDDDASEDELNRIFSIYAPALEVGNEQALGRFSGPFSHLALSSHAQTKPFIVNKLGQTHSLCALFFVAILPSRSVLCHPV